MSAKRRGEKTQSDDPKTNNQPDDDHESLIQLISQKSQNIFFNRLG